MVREWPMPAFGADRLREKRHSTRIARGSGEGSEGGGRNVAEHAERRGVETYAPEVPAKNLSPTEYKDIPVQGHPGAVLHDRVRHRKGPRTPGIRLGS
jgi:hypothetical protein